MVVTAEEVRSYKPAPGHLRRFQELTGAAPERLLPDLRAPPLVLDALVG